MRGARGLLAGLVVAAVARPASAEPTIIELPAPRLTGSVSVEQALAERRSRRSHARTPLSRAELGQLLWAAQGITDDKGHRTAPSAGARYPLEIYVLVAGGLFHYLPRRHALEQVSGNDLRDTVPDLYARPRLRDSTAFIISGVVERTRKRYGSRAERFVDLEAGAAGQNMLLEAVALGLVAVPVGAFDGPRVARKLRLRGTPVYAVIIGHPPPR